MSMLRFLPSMLSLALVACSSGPGPSPMSTSKATIAPSPAAPIEANAVPRATNVEHALIDERALVESEASRDPFRAFPTAPTPPPEDVRPRKSKRWSVEQLKLVGLVTNTAAPRAMLLDPGGRGWIVAAGDLVGRAETVRSGAGDHAVSWRVDRIRASEVVLVRDDAGSMGDASMTRVIALRQEPLLSASAQD